MKIERILYPTDFSAKSESAREHAIYMAQSLNSSLDLLHAIEPLDYDEMDEEIIDFYKGLENQLEEKMEAEKEIFRLEAKKETFRLVELEKEKTCYQSEISHEP